MGKCRSTLENEETISFVFSGCCGEDFSRKVGNRRVYSEGFEDDEEQDKETKVGIIKKNGNNPNPKFPSNSNASLHLFM